jgi:PEP-CTERM motif
MKLRTASLYLLTICLFALPAPAQNDLYNNGPTNGTNDAWTINFGFEISDTFTLTSNSTVNGLNFAAWLTPGDTLESVEVAITSSELGGTTYFDQQVNFAQSGCSGNQYGFNVCNELGSFSGVALNAGTYWLNLQNAVVNTGDPVYWDENDGPSLASNDSVGTLGSESFTVLGSSGSGTGTTPEPGSILLFGTGVLGIGAIVRRRLF